MPRHWQVSRPIPDGGLVCDKQPRFCSAVCTDLSTTISSRTDPSPLATWSVTNSLFLQPSAITHFAKILVQLDASAKSLAYHHASNRCYPSITFHQPADLSTTTRTLCFRLSPAPTWRIARVGQVMGLSRRCQPAEPLSEELYSRGTLQVVLASSPWPPC